MESRPHSVPLLSREELVRALAEQRDRVRQFLAAERQRVARVESELSERLRRFQEQMKHGREAMAARQAQLEAAEADWEEKSHSIELARQAQAAEQTELAELRGRIERRAAELDAAQEEIRAQQAQTEQQRQHIARALQSQHQRQWKELRSRQAELEEMAREASAAPAPEPDSDLQRRLEMAIGDLRQLRARNAELEQQLARQTTERAEASVRNPATPPSLTLNWEAEKRRILAALEEDDSEEEERVAERIKMHEVLQVTERALQEKDRELAEIRKVLEEQSNNLGGLAVGAAALGEIFDQDALIREERENLKRLQQQWEDTLRQAEVDISVERAKLARERQEIEEKLRAYEKLAGKPEVDATAAESGEKRVRGRWLARLGLKDPDAT